MESMEENNAKELDYTFQLLNYCKSLYQGRFAMLNVLQQCQHPIFKATELEKTKKIVEEVNHWLEEALQQRLIFSLLSVTPEQSKALAYLKSSKPELESLAKKVKATLVSNDHIDNNNAAIFILAAQANHTYFQDNFLQGISKIVKASGQTEPAPGLNNAIKSAAANTEQINQIVGDTLQNAATVESRHFARLAFIARNLAGNFRGLIHDLNQLIIGPTEAFTYKHAEFLQPEAIAWGAAGLNPAFAGYWRAHEFSIDEALDWSNQGIFNAALAAEWKTAGFPAAHAVAWINVLFPPLLAIQWANAGYHPTQAAVLLNSGFGLPEQVPAEQVQEILQTEFAKLQARAGQDQLLQNENVKAG